MITLFADVHYYLNAPGSKPQHDRFVRASYVYLIHDASEHKARLEIANHAGTPAQDAMNGDLDLVTIKWDKRQPNLTTFVIESPAANPDSTSNSKSGSWEVHSYDFGRENAYLQPLHSLDIYFWTAEDSAKFVDQCKRILPGRQMLLTPSDPSRNNDKRQSRTEHDHTASPIVQQLEHAAVTDAYRPRASTASTVQSHPTRSDSAGRTSSRVESPAPLLVPAAYNPAAPAAPERIAHREKTPPPLSAAAGTGLGAAAAMDEPTTPNAGQYHHHHQRQGSRPIEQGTPWASMQNGSCLSYSTSPSNIPQGGPQAPNLFPSTPRSFAPPPFTPTRPPPQYAPHQHALYDTPLPSPAYNQQTPMASPTFAPPPLSTPLASPTTANYTHAPPFQHANSHHSSIHQQFYRPTEIELAHGHGGHHKSLTRALSELPPGAVYTSPPLQQGTSETGSPKQGKVEARIGKLDKSVNRWFKKLEKI